MKKISIYLLSAFVLCLVSNEACARKWTLDECIDYALRNNISLQKMRISKLSAHEDVLQSKAELLPSLSASTSQNLVFQPFPESGRYTVANGTVESSVDKIYY
ncbi:MAG: TolC family protein, partial [Prevotella sp.]|nr:TolC family protein [Prevotella sp.]